MAEEIIGVKVQVDASDVGKSVGDLKKKIAEAEAQVKQLTKAYGEQSKEAIEAQKTLAQLQTITNKKIEQQNERIDNAAKTVSALSAAYGGVQGALELTGLAGEDTIKQLAKIQSALAIGDAVQNLAEFRGAITNTFSSFGKSIKTTFSTLRSGLIATGIGAFVIALGLVAANFETVKKVVLNFIPGLGKVADFIGNLVNKITDFVGVTSDAGRATEKLLQDNEKAIAKTERFLALNADKYDEFTQRKIKANLEFKKNENEILNDQKLSEDEKNAYIKQARDKANREIDKATKDRNNAAAEAKKKISDKELSDNEKDAQKKKEINDKEEQDRIQAEKDKQAREDAAFAVSKKAFIATLTEKNKELLSIEDEYENNRATLIRAGILDFAAIEEEKRLAILGVTAKYNQITFENDEKIRLDRKQKDEDEFKFLQELNQKTIDDALKVFEAKKAIQASEIDLLFQLSGILKQVAGNNKAIQAAAIIAENAAGIGRIIINTQVANAKSIAASPLTAGQPFVTINTISAALGVASSLLATRKALSSLGTGGSAGSAPSIAAVGGSAPIRPSEPQAQLTQLNQASINQMGSATGRAYVVESDITNSQEKIIRINRAARLG